MMSNQPGPAKEAENHQSSIAITKSESSMSTTTSKKKSRKVSLKKFANAIGSKKAKSSSARRAGASARLKDASIEIMSTIVTTDDENQTECTIVENPSHNLKEPIIPNSPNPSLAPTPKKPELERILPSQQKIADEIPIISNVGSLLDELRNLEPVKEEKETKQESQEENIEVDQLLGERDSRNNAEEPAPATDIATSTFKDQESQTDGFELIDTQDVIQEPTVLQRSKTSFMGNKLKVVSHTVPLRSTRSALPTSTKSKDVAESITRTQSDIQTKVTFQDEADSKDPIKMKKSISSFIGKKHKDTAKPLQMRNIRSDLSNISSKAIVNLQDSDEFVEMLGEDSTFKATSEKSTKSSVKNIRSDANDKSIPLCKSSSSFLEKKKHKDISKTVPLNSTKSALPSFSSHKTSSKVKSNLSNEHSSAGTASITGDMESAMCDFEPKESIPLRKSKTSLIKKKKTSDSITA